jgi:hypothetical protein
MCELGGGRVQAAFAAREAQDTRPHQPLDLPKSQVSKSMVPMEKFLLRLGKIVICFVDCRDRRLQSLNWNIRIRIAVGV